METALSSWMHVSICGVLLPRSFTRLSWSPRKLAPGTSATYGTSSRCSMRAIASLPHTSLRDDDGLGVSGTMGGTGLLGVIGSPPWATSRARVPPRKGEWQGGSCGPRSHIEIPRSLLYDSIYELFWRARDPAARSGLDRFRQRTAGPCDGAVRRAREVRRRPLFPTPSDRRLGWNAG